jgi:hypothetical protein
MTKFVRSQFTYDRGGYLMYVEGTERRFIARFKYAKCDKPGFLSFLIKHFTVEEWFAARDRYESELLPNGCQNQKIAPFTLMKLKGYVSLQERRMGIAQ